MTVLILGIAAVFLGLIGLYFYFYLKRCLRYWGAPVQTKWLRLLLAVAALLIAGAAAQVWGIGAIIVLHIWIASLLMDLVNGLLRRFRKAGWWKRIYGCGLLPLLLAGIVLGAGYWNMRQIVCQDYVIKTDKPIRSDGYTLAFLSDLHFGTTMDLTALTRYCEEIGQKHPDMVLLGGDIVDENTTKEEMRQVFQILGAVPSEYGTFFVYGNHDRASYTQTPHFTPEELEQALAAAGIRALSDEAVMVNQDILLVGREDASFDGSGIRAPSAELTAAAKPGQLIVVLDHQPRELAANQESGVDLQLSGHTHAGQIWPVGWINSLFRVNEVNYGYQQIESLQVIVSSGMAGWGYPIRTSGRSEYVMVRVENTENRAY